LLIASVGRREIDSASGQGKKSPLFACYQCGDNPGVYAMMATLISQSYNITFYPFEQRAKQADKWTYELRFLKHFRKLLGDDIEIVLARKLRIHVRRLCARIVAESERLRSKQLAKEVWEAQRSRRMEVEAEKKASNDDTVDEGDVAEWTDEDEERDGAEDYQWLLCQLRVFLLSYSLLDWFIQKQQRPPVKENPRGVAELEPIAWPLVCMNSCFFYSSLYCCYVNCFCSSLVFFFFFFLDNSYF
jgi:hypothetical protein